MRRGYPTAKSAWSKSGRRSRVRCGLSPAPNTSATCAPTSPPPANTASICSTPSSNSHPGSRGYPPSTDLISYIDIYSRYNPGWILAAAEDSVLARDFINEAIARNWQIPHTVHADRGTSMTSQPVSALLANLGVTRTHSRPRTSDDNPFSEAQFKTLKYLHDFPGSFPNLSAARAFCDGFFAEYNHVHRHSGIGWHTPASVHFATTGPIDQARQDTLDTARAAHPERFARRPRPPQIPDHSWINQPTAELQKI